MLVEKLPKVLSKDRKQGGDGISFIVMVEINFFVVHAVHIVTILFIVVTNFLAIMIINIIIVMEAGVNKWQMEVRVKAGQWK